MSEGTLETLEPMPTLLKRIRNGQGGAFVAGQPVRLSRAPGRLDVMGGIADYTGSLVCEMPLMEAVAAVSQVRSDRRVVIESLNLRDAGLRADFDITLDELADLTLDELRELLRSSRRTWAGYVIGCVWLLQEKGYLNLADANHEGLNLALLSTVPGGAGVSSSAALEVAAMTNFIGHFGLTDLETDGVTIAILCQEVENRVVGAPCGLMDQMASSVGQQGSLMQMLCQPDEVQEPLTLPEGIAVIGINTNVKHSVGGGAYGKTRCAAFMGKTLLGDSAGDYLANVDADTYEQTLRATLPITLGGDQFLDKHDSHGDTATKVEPSLDYHVRAATDHHVFEGTRVRKFARLLAEGTEESIAAAGQLMYESHASYGDNAGLGAKEADLLVELVRERESAGLFGARITGGGSGGTVAVLLKSSPRSAAAIDDVLHLYRQRTGLVPDLFNASSPGATRLGTTQISL